MKPRWFKLEELVYPEIFIARGQRCWELLDSRLITSIDALRDQFGSIVINNWHSGGTYKESGLRKHDTTTGAKFSQHKFGRAADCKFKHTTPIEVQKYVLANPNQFPLIRVIENAEKTKTWLHIDVRNTQVTGIQIVEP